MQAAGDPAVAALGTKPAPTPAKSVSEYYYYCYSMTRSISSIQNKAMARCFLAVHVGMVGGSKYIWIFSTSNALIISSQLFSIVSSGRDGSLSVMTFVTVWRGSWLWPLIVTGLTSSLCPGAPTLWNAILQNWYKAQNNTIVFLQESSFKIASRYFQPPQFHPHT